MSHVVGVECLTCVTGHCWQGYEGSTSDHVRGHALSRNWQLLVGWLKLTFKSRLIPGNQWHIEHVHNKLKETKKTYQMSYSQGPSSHHTCVIIIITILSYTLMTLDAVCFRLNYTTVTHTHTVQWKLRLNVFIIFIDAIYHVILCTILILIFIHYILTVLCNLLDKLVNFFVYLHYILCSVALTITTFGKTKCIFCNVIVNK